MVLFNILFFWRDKMTSAHICIMISIVVYLIAMLAIGIVCSKRNNTVDDFYLGGRRLGPVVTAMSAEASDMSSWLLMGLPGVAYLTGIADAGWTAIGLAVGTYFNWLIVARRLRNYSAHIGAITIPDFFTNRYKENKHILTAMAALIIIIFFVPYTASGFAACGKLFATIFGVDYHVAMIISAIVIVGYTATGGFTAASTTDLVQSIIMTIALVVVLIFGVNQAGGMEAVVDNASKIPGYISMTETFNPDTNQSSVYGALTIASTFAWGLGYFGMPHILLRFMAIESDKKIKTSRRIATVWVVISMGIAVFIGVVGSGMVANSKMGALADKETIIVEIANLLSQHGVVPALIAGVILAGILASTMSTADSQLLAASSGVSENILGSLFGLKLSSKSKMIVARLTLIVISVIGVILAWDKDSSVFKIVSFAWAGFGASFGPVMLLALFWKRSNKYGAIAGMIAGAVMVFLWKYYIAGLADILNIYELLPAFLFGLIVNVIVSLCTPAPDKEICDAFDHVKTM